MAIVTYPAHETTDVATKLGVQGELQKSRRPDLSDREGVFNEDAVTLRDKRPAFYAHPRNAPIAKSASESELGNDRDVQLPPSRQIAAALPLILILFTAMAGCGKVETDRLAVFPVEGTITLNGKPLANAFVVMHPKEPADAQTPPPRATTDSRGNFRVTTYDLHDGAPSGEYAITVQHFPLVKKGESFEPGPNGLPAKLAKPLTSNLPAVLISNAPLTLPPIAIRR